MPRVYVPAEGVSDWQARLAEPERNWKVGFSAHSLAVTWHSPASTSGSGFPPGVARVLSGIPALADLELLLALPEHQVSLPGGSRPSQTDLWLLAKCTSGLVSIAVEGKVNESFGPLLSEWLQSSSDGKRARLDFMSQLLELKSELPLSTRYQLLHRTASAVIEAQRFLARHAVLLVHSFSDRDSSLADYQAFAQLFGVSAGVDQAVSVGERSGVELHLAWVRSPLPAKEGV